MKISQELNILPLILPLTGAEGTIHPLVMSPAEGFVIIILPSRYVLVAVNMDSDHCDLGISVVQKV